MLAKTGVFLILCCSGLFAQSPTASADNTPATPRVLATKSNAAFLKAASGHEQPLAPGAIVFISEWERWVINADGSGLKQLSHLKVDADRPLGAWSPDGNRVAYVDYRRLEGDPFIHPNVWVKNTDGGVMPLTSELKRIFYNVTWSLDGHKLAAASQRTVFDENRQIKYLSNDIFMVKADGSGEKVILELADPNTHFQRISWSPDGRKIAFLLNRSLGGDDWRKGMTQNLWVMDADGSNPTPLTKLTENYPRIQEIAWSPDSKRVTYISSRALDGSDAGAAGSNIWVSNADGSDSFPLTRFKHAAFNAFSWSPDGSRLTFSSTEPPDGSDRAANMNIWLLKMDGSAPVALTHETKIELSNDRPAWSPDGSLIAFVSCINSTSAKPREPFSDCKLSVMKEDGTGVRQLTEKSVLLFQWRQ